MLPSEIPAACSASCSVYIGTLDSPAAAGSRRQLRRVALYKPLLLAAHPAPFTLEPLAFHCRMKEAAEAEVAELAKAAAKADSMARAAQKAEMGAAQMLELQRLKVRDWWGLGAGGAASCGQPFVGRVVAGWWQAPRAPMSALLKPSGLLLLAA